MTSFWRSALSSLAFLITACAQAEPQPYLAKPTVSFHSIKRPAEVAGLDPYVTYVGGYAMQAVGTSLFEGLSDLRVTSDAGNYHITVLSDFGRIVDFDLRPAAQGFAPSPLSITDLRDVAGAVFDLRSLSDSEDMAVDEVSGDVFVSFERRSRIWRYPKGAFAQSAQDVPINGIRELPFNEGIEALTMIDAGHLLLGIESGGFYLCETVSAKPCRPVQGVSAPGFLYKIVSLDTLPAAEPVNGGNIIALWRYYDPFSGPRAMVTLMKWDGKTLKQIKVLAKIAPPMPVDNYEGVSAVATKDGYRLFLIADTLDAHNLAHLLVFEWRTR
jgi:hypothetical protein